MLGDIGGFHDGLRMIFGYLIFVYNSRWYLVKLNSSIFFTGKHQNNYEDSVFKSRQIDKGLVM